MGRQDRWPGEDRWCILRTNGGRTLVLAKSLVSSGIEAWTPTRTDVQRVPRTKGVREREVPIMPTFVFVRARHIDELRRCRSLPNSPHPPFSLFRYAGGIPLIADREISSVREMEDRGREARRLAQQRDADAARRRVRRHIAAGTSVTVEDAGFSGLSGIVEESDGRFALVCFGGAMRVKVASFLVHVDALEQTKSETSSLPDTAAQAA